jgi:ABC-type multidrug transport system permease subunit
MATQTTSILRPISVILKSSPMLTRFLGLSLVPLGLFTLFITFLLIQSEDRVFHASSIASVLGSLFLGSGLYFTYTGKAPTSGELFSYSRWLGLATGIQLAYTVFSYLTLRQIISSGLGLSVLLLIGIVVLVYRK